MTLTVILAVVAAIVAISVLIGIGRLIASGRAPSETRTSTTTNGPPYDVALTCRVNGHAYLAFETGWRCATCGNHISRREGEKYGLAKDGRYERRREAR